jgi:hypothetical protein
MVMERSVIPDGVRAARERCLFDGLRPDEHTADQLAQCIADICALVPNPLERLELDPTERP